jgi:hypothetical protein
MIDYRGKGKLIGCFRIQVGLYLVCVDLGHEFVVSRYLNGDDEWVAGRYFEDRDGAIADFGKRVVGFSEVGVM